MRENLKTEQRQRGKVWLVGAGPSDAGLFTLKGKQILEQADVVVYDRLVGQGIMSMIPANTRKIPVGKESGHHPVPQEQINAILLEEALNGNRVVRLKGGDPFVFGRGGEELELLCEHGIPFEIVPGVTSAVAVPAYHGIPVTHRNCCSSMHVITGHAKKNESTDIDYEALVRLNGTLIFLMGVTAMPEICRGLLEAGMPPDMPAAVLERGTTAHQRRVVSDVAHLPENAERAKIQTPAVLIVGKVCSLAERFHWAEDRLLGGLKIAVTRPKERSSVLAQKLELLGAEVVLMPTIETKPIENNKMFIDALDRIGQYTWAVFTSVAGVQVFYDALAERKQDIRSLAGLKFAAIGTATKRAIETRGILVDLMPEKYNGKHLGQLLAETAGPRDRILIPRAKKGTEEVIEPLRQAGILCDDIPVYDTVEGAQGRVEKNTANENTGYDESVDYVAFTSASTVRGFVKQNPNVDYNKVQAVCIGEQTAAEACRHGMVCTIAEEATIDSMIDVFLRINS